jgi:hypothetical protein
VRAASASSPRRRRASSGPAGSSSWTAFRSGWTWQPRSAPTTLNQRNVSILGVGYYEAAHLQRSLDLMLRRREQYPFDRIVSDIFPLEEVENVLAEQNKGHITRAA